MSISGARVRSAARAAANASDAFPGGLFDRHCSPHEPAEDDDAANRARQQHEHEATAVRQEPWTALSRDLRYQDSSGHDVDPGHGGQ